MVAPRFDSSRDKPWYVSVTNTFSIHDKFSFMESTLGIALARRHGRCRPRSRGYRTISTLLWQCASSSNSGAWVSRGEQS